MIKVNKTLNPDQLVELVQKAETEGERIILEQDGQGKVAIISYADLEYLEALEDARDSEELRQAVEESKGQPSITFEELLEELGLTIEDLKRESNLGAGQFCRNTYTKNLNRRVGKA